MGARYPMAYTTALPIRSIQPAASGKVVVGWVPIELGPKTRSIPVPLVEEGVVWSAYKHMLSPPIWNLSASSLKHKAAALKKLFEFQIAVGESPSRQIQRPDFYEAFAHALANGTFANGVDQLGLLWHPNKTDTLRIHLAAIRGFAEFLTTESTARSTHPKIAKMEDVLAGAYHHHIDTRKSASPFHKRASIRYLHVSSDTTETQQSRSIFSGSMRRKQPPIPFPEKHVEEFFRRGLLRRGRSDKNIRNYLIRDYLYFLLLMWGAIRGSEALHIFLSDVQRDQTHGQGASVFLYHPSEGAPPGPYASKFSDRKEYLREVYGRVPRNEMNNLGEFAGWKSMLMTETVPRVGDRTRVFWQSPAAGHLFWQLHGIYINEIRPNCAKHPYYFVNLDRSGGSFGAPWSDAGARNAFESALARIGLVPDSAQGLCRHAMRHRVGYMLKRAGVPSEIIQEVLHQQCIGSQMIYTRPRPRDVFQALSKASQKIELGIADFSTEDLGLTWKSDPHGIFEGPGSKATANFLKGVI